MLRSILHGTIRRFEHLYDYDARYMHEILDASLPAFVKLLLARPLTTHRAGVPAEALFAAGMAAVRFEDCGPCAQLAVNMGREAGIAPAALRAIVACDTAAMSSDARLGLALADAVLAHAPCDELRDEVRRRWGDAALVTLAYGITAARIYPTLKRVLGHAHACERLQVEGELVPAARPA